MFTVERKADRLEFLLAARFELVDRVCAEVEGLLAEHGLEDLGFVALLGLREALTNAICHGAGLDPDQEIGVTVRREESALVILVTDPGAGFDWKRIIAAKLAAMKQQPSRLSTRGRGIGILLHYFDEVSFNPRGNVVKLQLRIPAGERHAP